MSLSRAAVLMTFSLSVLHAGVPTHLNFERSSCEASSEYLYFCSCLSFDLASYLVVSGRLDSDMCALIDRSAHLVEPNSSLSCFKHHWHRFVGCLSRLFLVSLCLCTWRLTCLWTDVRIFLHLCTASDGRFALVCIGLTAVSPESAKLCPACHSCELL